MKNSNSTLTNEKILNENFILVFNREYKNPRNRKNSPKLDAFDISEENISTAGRFERKETFDNWGRIEKIENYQNGNQVSINAYKYDINGNEIEDSFSQNNNSKFNFKTRSFYNEQNRLVKMEIYNSQNLIKNYVLYDYNFQGNRIMIISRNSLGKLDYKFRFDHSQDNKIIKEYCFKGNGHLAWEANYIYDSKSFLIEIEYTKKSVVFYKTIYTRDSAGSKLSTMKYIHKDHIKRWGGIKNGGHIDFLLWTHSN